MCICHGLRIQLLTRRRCFIVLADKISQMPAGEDKRIRKELQVLITGTLFLSLLSSVPCRKPLRNWSNFAYWRTSPPTQAAGSAVQSCQGSTAPAGTHPFFAVCASGFFLKLASSDLLYLCRQIRNSTRRRTQARSRCQTAAGRLSPPGLAIANSSRKSTCISRRMLCPMSESSLRSPTRFWRCVAVSSQARYHQHSKADNGIMFSPSYASISLLTWE